MSGVPQCFVLKTDMCVYVWLAAGTRPSRTHKANHDMQCSALLGLDCLLVSKIVLLVTNAADHSWSVRCCGLSMPDLCAHSFCVLLRHHPHHLRLQRSLPLGRRCLGRQPGPPHLHPHQMCRHPAQHDTCQCNCSTSPLLGLSGL